MYLCQLQSIQFVKLGQTFQICCTSWQLKKQKKKIETSCEKLCRENLIYVLDEFNLITYGGDFSNPLMYHMHLQNILKNYTKHFNNHTNFPKRYLAYMFRYLHNIFIKKALRAFSTRLHEIVQCKYNIFLN